MIIFPAIDIKKGKCVRLSQGRADRETVYGHDPAAKARKWQAAGAAWLHVVDLDGAFTSRPRNLEAICAIRSAVPLPMQLGGGIRSLETIAAYIDLGIHRLILGTAVLKDPDLVARACAAYPGRIAVGLDARDGLLAVEGWTETSQRTAVEVEDELLARPWRKLKLTQHVGHAYQVMVITARAAGRLRMAYGAGGSYRKKKRRRAAGAPSFAASVLRLATPA